MRKYLGYEVKKYFSTPYVLAGVIAPLLLFFVALFISLKNFPDSYFSWLRVSNARHIFEYMFGKGAILTSMTFSFIAVFSGYLIFYREFKQGTIQRIIYSTGYSGRILDEKIRFFMILMLCYVLFYLIVLTLSGEYFLIKHSSLLKGQSRFLFSFFGEYFAVYAIYTFRTAFMVALYFSYFKANISSLSVLIVLHVVGFLFPYLPFFWVYTSETGFIYCALPALGYMAVFYTLNRQVRI